MNWKPITNLEGLPIGDHELVLIHYKSGAQETAQVFRVRTGQILGGATHWAIVEPPKRMTDDEAYVAWYRQESIVGLRAAFMAGVLWERSK